MRSLALLKVCILTGGLSTRMGQDKSRLRLGNRTMIGRIRVTVKSLGLKARIIRKDVVNRCGPLGGIYTALTGSRTEVLMMLACDMPFVSKELLHGIAEAMRAADRAVFASRNGQVGFPLILRRELCERIVLRQIERREYSLQHLAQALRARKFKVPENRWHELMNINTPDDLESARKLVKALSQA